MYRLRNIKSIKNRNNQMSLANIERIPVVSGSFRASDPESSEWNDWRWQQRNTIRDEASLREACGGWSSELSSHIRNNLNGRKLQITPYYLRLILDSRRGTEITENPLWRQV